MMSIRVARMIRANIRASAEYICGMKWIDTHAHMYLPQFDADRAEWVSRAKREGLTHVFLPNIDLESISQMENLVASDPSFFIPMMGLHPCDVKENFEEVLDIMEAKWNLMDYVAVGEIGIDLYWDKSTLDIQKTAFHRQITWALKKDKPIVIHARDAFDEIFEVLDTFSASNLRGIFHCFTGNQQQAEKVLSYGTFLFGIGGVLTYEKSGVDQVVANIPIEKIVLETDAPFLTPKPYRGKRNECSYIPIIAQKLALVKNMPLHEVAEVTSANALRIFDLV